MQKQIASAIAILEGAKLALIEDLGEELEKKAAPSPPRIAPRFSSRKVFVVHGHDDTARHEVARFLEHLDLIPIIQHEQVSKNQTIIEKIESYGREVGFAVVLLTPDDMGGNISNSLQPRARQPPITNKLA